MSWFLQAHSPRHIYLSLSFCLHTFFLPLAMWVTQTQSMKSDQISRERTLLMKYWTMYNNKALAGWTCDSPETSQTPSVLYPATNTALDCPASDPMKLHSSTTILGRNFTFKQHIYLWLFLLFLRSIKTSVEKGTFHANSTTLPLLHFSPYRALKIYFRILGFQRPKNESALKSYLNLL